MKILIIGAGAVGGYYGAKLTLAGEDVTFLARGATLEALQKQDLVVHSFCGDFQTPVRVISDLNGYSSPDLILLCVKSYDTDAVIEQIRNVVGERTLFLSFQNGVENEIKLAAAFGTEKILGCLCYIGSEVTAPGVIRHNARGTVSLGEMAGGVTERVQKIVDAFKRADIDIHASEDIQKDLWTKLCWNTAFNQVCAVARASVGAVLDSPVMWKLIEETMKEVCAIAACHDVILGQDMIDRSLALSDQDLRSVRPSMLQDLEHGHRLEHETFSGFLVREGKKFGVPVPINQVLYDFLKFFDLHPDSRRRS
jgi:2-dehydropantoate 2-reductase